MTTRRPFFPRNKPKSWVVAISAGLIALLVAGPLMLLGKLLAWSWLFGSGVTLFMLCWATFVLMWLVGVVGLLSGRYRQMIERDWDEQVW
jgi:hypothetical protein